jgi:hypothetical protein
LCPCMVQQPCSWPSLGHLHYIWSHLESSASNGENNSWYWIEVLSSVSVLLCSSKRSNILKEHTDSIFRAEGFAKQEANGISR